MTTETKRVEKLAILSFPHLGREEMTSIASELKRVGDQLGIFFIVTNVDDIHLIPISDFERVLDDMIAAMQKK
jgi:hypothetical protein